MEQAGSITATRRRMPAAGRHDARFPACRMPRRHRPDAKPEDGSGHSPIQTVPTIICRQNRIWQLSDWCIHEFLAGGKGGMQTPETPPARRIGLNPEG